MKIADRNIFDKFKELLNRAENKKGGEKGIVLYWNVLLGLRGPDDKLDFEDDDALKSLTASRIRYFVGLRIPNSMGCIVNESPLLQQHQIERRDQLLIKAGEHYFTHFKLALAALRELGYDIPDNEFIEDENVRPRIFSLDD